jgi:hypothetical protein
MNQAIILQPGWNAIFLEVQPEPRSCDAIFSGIPIESVWGWNRRFSPVQFIRDANSLVAPSPDWLTYVPAGNPMYSQKTLYNLEGGKC